MRQTHAISLGPLHHIGIVVPSLDAAFALFAGPLGGTRVGGVIPVERVARLGFVQMPGVLVELIEPIAAGTDLADFLAAHPGGAQHHVCHQVDDIAAAWAEFEAAGATFLCPIVPGVLGFPIFFVQLPALPGLQIELIQVSPASSGIEDGRRPGN